MAASRQTPSVSLLCLVTLATLLACTLCVHGVRITAAFQDRNQLYLISGNRYIVLRNRREVMHYPITRLGLPYNVHVKAAVRSSNSAKPTFFYTKNRVFLTTSYNTRHLPTLIRTGIDAVASRLGTEYYFRGCEYIQRWPNRYQWLSSRSRTTRIRLPCHVDAAWTEGYSMVVLKGNKIWIWGFAGVIGPILFKDRYSVHSWTIY